ncbi:MAG: glycosyltransferase family 2 protein [Bacteroides sp.]|nr:glycosyltransferase family 2 protein [Bacteroides sp.]MCM1412740.1 glycosyltransferase family 2 protein [Bacteroides sp.]MCM1470966.1 glycosyltransferase family 2 protein [Bacteroides sp.]
MVIASIVVFHTDVRELERVLGSLAGGCVEAVYVVDNSHEQSMRLFCEEYVRRTGFDVRYLSSENAGYGAGHNIAIRRSMEAGAKYHIVMNSDVEFRPEDLQKLVDYMESNDNVGAVQPKIVNPDGSLQYTVRMLPTPLDMILRRFTPSWVMPMRRKKYELRHLDHDREFDVAYHQGSLMFLRVKALVDVGLFDERFFMYPEDIDLTRRIHRNYLTMYYPAMTVVHDHRASSYHNYRMMWVHIVNMIRYFNKWGWFFDPERRRINRGLMP